MTLQDRLFNSIVAIEIYPGQWDQTITVGSTPAYTFDFNTSEIFNGIDFSQIDWATLTDDYEIVFEKKEEKLPEVSEKDMEDLWN